MRKQFTQADLYASIGTAIFCGIFLLFLLLFTLAVPSQEEEEGMLISFGTDLDGFGSGNDLYDPSVNAQPIEQNIPQQTSSSSSSPSLAEDIMTQNTESAAVIAANRRKAEQERIAKAEAAEKERQYQAEVARQAAIEAERKQKADQAKNLASGAFGNGGSSSGSGSGNLGGVGSGQGNTSGNGMQGNPLGSGSSGGNSFSLEGRALKGKIYEPQYESNEVGRIIVAIRVDANGNVISASITTGTNITDQTLRNATLEAARKTKFTSGSNVAVGTLTYNFNLK